MKYIVSVFLFLLIEGCWVIQINENSYRALSDSDKKFVRPFHTEIVSTRVNNSDSVFIYEINTNDIKALIHKQPYTWVHLWRPFCHADICQNVDYFFKDSTLIYTGTLQSKTTIDSLIKVVIP